MIKILLGLILRADDATEGYRRIVGYFIMLVAILLMIGAWLNHNYAGGDQSSFNEAMGIANKVLFVGFVVWTYGWSSYITRNKDELKSKLKKEDIPNEFKASNR